MNMNNPISTQIRKGILEFFLLSILKEKSKYPREIIDQLNHYGFNLVEGTIYPLFLRLSKNNLVQYEWVEASGHPRKYYTLTEQGKEALEQYEKEWNALNNILYKIKANERY
jgi:PadR family transcriptional regulator PadR